MYRVSPATPEWEKRKNIRGTTIKFNGENDAETIFGEFVKLDILYATVLELHELESLFVNEIYKTR